MYEGCLVRFRLRIALARKDVAKRVESVPVDLVAAEHKQPAFPVMNPKVTVLVL